MASKTIGPYALVTLDNVKDYYGLEGTDPEENDVIIDLIDSMTELSERYTLRKLKAREYTEYYNARNNKRIILKQYPVNTITKVAVGKREVMTIWNTSTYTSATAAVTSTGLTLTKDGAADTSITFAGNATITLVVAAVNALGSGWASEIRNSTYASFQSSELITRHPGNAIHSNRVDLDILEEPLDEYEVDDGAGIIYLPYSVSGVKKVYVSYNAGYSTIPSDLKQVNIEEVVRMFKHRREPDLLALTAEDGTTTLMNKDLLPSTIRVLNRYKKKGALV